MAGEIVYDLVSAVHAGDSLAGAVMARIMPGTKTWIDPGVAGWPGDADAHVSDFSLEVELFGMGDAELLARIGHAAGDLVLTFHGTAGASQSFTISNVYFGRPAGGMDVPAKDRSGRVPTMGVRGAVHWAAGETFADVVTAG